MSEQLTFEEWFPRQHDRGDFIGELVRELENDAAAPRTFRPLAKYLDDRPEDLLALFLAHQEHFRRFRRSPSRIESLQRNERRRAKCPPTAQDATEYLTTAQVAELLCVTPKTIRNKVAAGVFRQGEHFFRKPGLGPRWKRDSIVHWLENEEAGGVDVFALAQPGGGRIA